MNTHHANIRYVEWLSADDMYKASQEWLSELRFIKDEHLFFDDLIKSFTLQLIKPGQFSKSKKIIDVIDTSQKRNNLLIEAVKTHLNELQIMVDGIDQPKEEEAYKEEHRNLIIIINNYFKEYRMLKTQVFSLIKGIKKSEKQERLIDRE